MGLFPDIRVNPVPGGRNHTILLFYPRYWTNRPRSRTAAVRFQRGFRPFMNSGGVTPTYLRKTLPKYRESRYPTSPAAS